MEINGKIKVINETKTFGANGFKNRTLVVTTAETYPQHVLIEFTQDKCDMLSSYKQGDEVKVSINIKGREWQNPTSGEIQYFNTIQGWRIEKTGGNVHEPVQQQPSNTGQNYDIEEPPF